jgi:hypothetical protein
MNYRLILCLLLIVAMVGIVSADTLLVYLSEGTGDRYMRNQTASTWTALRNGNGDSAGDGASTSRFMIIRATTVTNQFNRLYRFGYGFNTSPMPDDATITGVSNGLVFKDPSITLGSFSFGITGFTPATTANFQASDFTKFTNTRYATDIPNTSITNDVYTNFTWNTDGKSAINKTGYTNFMLRFASDIDDSSPTWVRAGESGYAIYDYTEISSKQPFLEIVYTTEGISAPVASFTCTKNFVRIPNSVTCTDGSTNTPTSWSWDMGDGSAAVTTQNITYQYTKRGMWGITLNATNAQGSNVSASNNVRVAGYENGW